MVIPSQDPGSLPARASGLLKAADMPRDAQEAVRVAALLGLAIPLECLPGVTANLALLAHHARIFQGREGP